MFAVIFLLFLLFLLLELFIMLNIQNLYSRFEDKIIFENFQLNLENNDIFALEGISGSGKTTLLNILMGFNVIYTGEIKFGDLDRRAHV